MNPKTIACLLELHPLTSGYLLNKFPQISEILDEELQELFIEIEETHLKRVSQTDWFNRKDPRANVFFGQWERFLVDHPALVDPKNSSLFKTLALLIRDEIVHYNEPTIILNALDKVYFKYIKDERVVLELFAKYLPLYQADELGLSHLVSTMVTSFISPPLEGDIDYPETFYPDYVDALFRFMNNSKKYENTKTWLDKKFDDYIYPFLADNINLFSAFGSASPLDLELLRLIYNEKITENKKAAQV